MGGEQRQLLQAQFPAVDPPAAATPAGPSATPLSLVCGLECTSTANCPSLCAQQIRTIDAPGNSFTMECTGAGACAASQYTFNYANAGALTRYFEGIQVGTAYALYGSTVTFDNSARGGGLTVRKIDCGGGLCAG